MLVVSFLHSSTQTAAVYNLPVVGEAFALAAICCKCAGAGILTLFGLSDASKSLLRGARMTRDAYLSSNCIASNVRVLVAKIKHEEDEVQYLLEQQRRAWIAFLMQLPTIGYFFSIYRYIKGETNYGHHLMIASTSLLAAVVVITVVVSLDSGPLICGAVFLSASLTFDSVATLCLPQSRLLLPVSLPASVPFLSSYNQQSEDPLALPLACNSPPSSVGLIKCIRTALRTKDANDIFVVFSRLFVIFWIGSIKGFRNLP